MAVASKQHSHDNITIQHSCTHIHFLIGWLTFQRVLLHNWTIGKKFQTMKSNVIAGAVAFHSDEGDVSHTYSVMLP